jgi:putative Mn2+ efflux pump MntP
VSGPPSRGWEAVDHAEDRLRERATARQRDGDLRRRRRRWTAWALRVLLPILGAAAVLAGLDAAGGDLRGWSATAAVAGPALALLLPAVAVGLTARRDGVVLIVLWTLVGLAAEFVLVFGAGFGLLGLGPR